MQVYTPKKGYTHNPLNKAEFRNLSCPCESGKKVKKCCGRQLYVEQDWADTLNEALKNLVTNGVQNVE